MSRRLAAVPRRERAAAAVEMAIVLPLLLLIVGGIIDFGRFFYTQNIVVNAAREGARSRALGYTTAASDTRISQSLTGVQGGANTNSYWLVQGAANTLTAAGTPPLATARALPGRSTGSG